MHRSVVRILFFLLAAISLNGTPVHAQQRPAKPVRGVQPQAAQQPCLPEDEPCGGGGEPGSVTVVPDDDQMTVYLGSTNNVAEFVVTNNYSSGYSYSLSCNALGVGTCTSIKNVSGTTITSIYIPANGSVFVTARFTASSSPTSGLVRLTANNGIWSDNGAYAVTVTPPPAIVWVTPDSGTQHVGSNTAAPYVFTVNNAGLATQSYTFTCSIVGAGSCGTVSPNAATLAAGASTQVTVNATSGSSNGQVVLTAGGDATDAGRYYLTVLPGTPGILAPTLAAPSPGPSIDRGLCLTVNLGAAASECGALRLAHALPTTTIYGNARTPTLLYNSATAAPTPIVAVNVAIPAGRLVPQSVEVILRVNGVERNRGTWSGNAWVNSGPRRVALAYSAAADSSGVHPYQVEVAAIYPGARHATVLSGELVVINRSTSPFGSGWWLAGLEQLKIVGANLQWIGGDGSARRYTSAGAGVWTAANPTRPDTIKSDGVKYSRILPGGGEVRFDLTGRHTATVNRLGRATTFAYNGTGQLQTISLARPGGTTVYTFAYSGGSISSITAPPIGATPRVVLAGVTSGKLMWLRDPDAAQVSFVYTGGSSVVTGRTDRRGIATTYTYANGLVTGATVASVAQSPYATLRHQESMGLCCTSEDTSKVYARIDGPRTDVADSTIAYLGMLGSPLRTVSPSGATTRVSFGDARWPALPTRMVGPSGQVLAAVYDDQGLMLSHTDSSRSTFKMVGDVGVTFYATTRYEFDSRWRETTKIVPPEGDSTLIAYDPTTGNRLWQQDASGSAARVTYQYNVDGQVAAVRQGGIRIDSMAYDSLGNLATQTDALGFVTAHTRDQIGRDTLTTTPLDSLKVHRFTQIRRYDLADRVWLERTYGPALPEGASDTLEIRTWHNPESLVDSLSRRSYPDPNNVGAMVTTYRYDNAGRTIRERDPVGAVDSMVYDPAGNLTARRTRRGHWINSTFDIENRRVRQVIPAVTFGKTVPEAGGTTQWIFKDTLPNGTYVIPADTLIFGYDLAGNMILADNNAAQVRRVYNQSGQLLWDTLRTRTVAPLSAGGSFQSHQYVVGYEYDLDGRRTALQHPTQLTPAGQAGPLATQRYTYDAVGRLSKVFDLSGREYRYRYNLFGQVDSIIYPPGDVAEVFTYNAAGQRTSQVGLSPRFATTDSGFTNGVFRQETMRYDGRGKTLYASALRDTTNNYYNARGVVVRSNYDNDTGPGQAGIRQDFGADALGNNRWSEWNDDIVPGSTLTWHILQPGTGRELTSYTSNGAMYLVDQYYDLAGNRILQRTRERYDFYPINPPDSILEDYWSNTRYLYNADDRLMVTQVARHFDGWDPPHEYAGDFRSFFEESRYDALGRRVLKRSRGLLECNGQNLTDCIPSIERIVYDGEEVLWEIRYPGEQAMSAANLERDTAQVLGDSRHFGRIGYINSPSIDRPLGLVRIGYGRDYSDGAGFKSFGVLEASVHYTWRGLPDLMIYDNGSAKRCLQYYTGQTLRTRCVDVVWPVRSAFLSKHKRPVPYDISWMGSVARDGEDDGGLMFRRNRFYDPSTGRFTQEDPIGLAGGVNLYGYANGDPITYADPFGLCPVTPWDPIPCIPYALPGADLRNLSPDAMRGLWSLAQRSGHHLGISATTNGVHKVGSAHYSGNAFDISQVDFRVDLGTYGSTRRSARATRAVADIQRALLQDANVYQVITPNGNWRFNSRTWGLGRLRLIDTPENNNLWSLHQSHVHADYTPVYFPNYYPHIY